MERLDFLYSAAVSYYNLLHKEYHLTGGRKGNTVEFRFRFLSENFYHLAGLHYLTDLQLFGKKEYRSDKAVIFKKILSQSISYAAVQQSAHFPQIADRIQWLHKIDGMIARLLFPKAIFVNYINRYSSGIPSGILFYEDYMTVADTFLYLFFALDTPNDYFVPDSFIVANNNRKLMNQMKYSVLKMDITICN